MTEAGEGDFDGGFCLEDANVGGADTAFGHGTFFKPEGFDRFELSFCIPVMEGGLNCERSAFIICYFRGCGVGHHVIRALRQFLHRMKKSTAIYSDT